MPLTYWVMSAIVGLLLFSYLVARRSHVCRIHARLMNAGVVPPAEILSWSFPSAAANLPVVSEDSLMLPSTAGPTRPPSAAASVPQMPKHTDGLANAGIDAFLSSLPSLHDLATIDWNVVDAIRSSASTSLDLSKWPDLRAYVDDHYFQVGQPEGFLNRLVGYVGEQKAGAFLAEQGHSVEFPSVPNQPGYDFHADGQPIQVKVGGDGVDGNIHNHFEKYPDIPVVTAPEHAADFSDNGMVAGLDGLDVEHLHGPMEHTLDVIHNDLHAGGPTIPVVTSIRSGLRELGLLVGGRTDLASAAKNAGLDVAGTGLGGWAGAKVGAIAGLPFGPHVAFVTAILGGVGGAILMRMVTNEIKMKPFKEAAEAYERTASVARETILAKEKEAHERVTSALEIAQKAFQSSVKTIQEKVRKLHSQWQDWHQKKTTEFVNLFPEVLSRLAQGLGARRRMELGAIKRSNFFRRLVWPRSSDVEYTVKSKAFEAREKAIGQARGYFEKLVAGVPRVVSPMAAVKEIEGFLRKHPFESPDMNSICAQLEQATREIADRKRGLADASQRLVAKERSRHERNIRELLAALAEEIAKLIEREVAAVKEAERVLVAEGNKLGIELGPSSGGET